MKYVTGKMGNMRKVADWIIYPSQNDDLPNRIYIQCNKRIALVNTKTGKAVLSSGKVGNHFVSLSKEAGSIVVDCPEDMLKQIREKTDNPIVNPVRIV